MKGITKRFPGVLANDNIDLEIKAGEIHALLGENGAGKTTLMNILYGVHQPDEGEIYVRGKKVDIDSPLDAIELGIGMVHQHLKLIPAHTVLENIILGHPKAGKILDKKKAEREIKELCDKYGFKVDLDAKVWQLSSGEKQIVEIVKALYRGAKLLILDEPTSALTPPETEELLESLKTMAKDEYAIIPFITHKLSMVLDISDRVTVLRDGRAVDRLKTKNATKDSLAEKMVGREVLFEFERPDVEIGKEILKTKNLTALNDRGFPAIRNLSFPIHEGEIFAIVGVAGNGQQELAEVLMGLRDLKKGKITFRGEDITNSPVKERWEKGMGYIPAERVEMGSIGDFSLVDNITMNLYWNDVYSQKGILDKEKLCECTEEACEVFDIKTPDIYTPAKSLSGGNLQKLIVARIFECNPELLIANLPTHGLDVGAAEFVANKLLEAKKNKTGILLISENLDEALSLADTVAPIYEGEFMGILPREKVTKNKVGLMMAGEKG
ncbi:MAG: ABC transporter ATP-binding protein [Hadesarchaea archaeon]|nr:ABC transporter ATP-binding protein [Hadesarchaea archaeon]